VIRPLRCRKAGAWPTTLCEPILWPFVSALLDWYEKYKGPPPSDSGYYVLAQLRPTETGKGPIKGSILVAAQDLFFALVPAANAKELIKYTKDNLKPDYKVKEEPTEVKIVLAFAV